MLSSKQKLTQLRESMKLSGIDAYIIPNTDPNLGEYIPEHWRIVKWLSGFTGSAADIVITKSFAGLWTDSRYFIQAASQLHGSGIKLMKINNADPSLTDWLQVNIKKGNTIGVDGRLISIGTLRKMMVAAELKECTLNFETDLISDLWEERPSMPVSIAFDHSTDFCGRDRAVKLDMVREEMKMRRIDWHLLTSVDDIMWLLNIRGNDLQYSPLLTSFAIVREEQVLLFTDERKIPFKMASLFDKMGIVILPYDEITSILSSITANSTILLAPKSTSATIFYAIPDEVQIIEDISIPSVLKAIKNNTEIKNIRSVMIRDGVALTRFFLWLDRNIEKEKITEQSAAHKLRELRLQQANCTGESFATIMAYNEHAALPHYSFESGPDTVIQAEGILLVDSGGQYLDGTTDITRCVSMGRPTREQRTDFTLVLKGTIAIAMAKFPEGTKGHQLDILARKYLWDNGINFGHGTGHGVGFYLNVHEGPQSISPNSSGDSKAVLEPGMVISDEPAIYREGKYGFRTENIVLVTEDKVTEYGKFLKFETLSVCYIDSTLIDISLLDANELQWLNNYHSIVYEKISPFLTKDEREWLKERTKEISTIQ
jgi:Xaa-Pro aminopeptidase